MESRFFNILTEGLIENDVAIEGVTHDYADNAVVKLPGVADRLNNIETLMYANASEAVTASVTDLGRYIKLLALESYNDISIKALESATVSGDTIDHINHSLTNTIGYSLRLIEPIEGELADNLREALEGYLYLTSKGVTLEMEDTMRSITNALHVVLESALETELSEIEYENNEIVALESVITAVTEDLDDEYTVDLLHSMTEMCESAYDEACESLIRLEGEHETMFDTAMEVMLGRGHYQDKNKEDAEKVRVGDLKKRISGAKNNAKKYVSELRKLQLDLDIERSRNNNLKISNRLEKKVDKTRYSVNDDVDAINDKLAELNKIDPKDPGNNAKIEALVDDIENIYSRAKSAAEKSRDDESSIIQKERDRQVRKASKGSIAERALNRLNGALKRRADSTSEKIKHRTGEAYRQLDADLKSGKIDHDEYVRRAKQIEAREKRDEARIEKIHGRANARDKMISGYTDKKKAEREKIIADGGKLYRDKDLVEKDIKEANKQANSEKKVSKTKKEKVEAEPKVKEPKEEKVALVDPRDKSLFVDNWGSLTPDQQKEIKSLRSKYIKAYNNFKNANPSDSNYDELKNVYETRLSILRKKISGAGAPSGTETKPKREKSKKKKGTSSLRESLSDADRVHYDNLLNNLTQLSTNKDELEKKKDRTPEEERKLQELLPKLTEAQNKYNSFVKRHQAMQAAGESIANNLFENIDVLQYAINEGYSVYDMTEMTSEAFESFIAGIEDQIYDDCYIVAMEAVAERESRKERKARKAAEKEAATKAREEAIRKERSEARDKVIAYAEERIEALKTLRKDIGKKWSVYSNDVKNLTERAEKGNLRGLRHARSRKIVQQSVGGGKFDFKKYTELLKELDDAEKELSQFIKSKDFYDQYDKTDKPKKDYKAAIRKINGIVGLIGRSKLNKLVDKAIQSEMEIDKLGKELDGNSVVQHERDDKASYRAKQIEEAEKKDRKDNPDKYKLKDTKSEHAEYLKRRAELEKKHKEEVAKRQSTVSPAEVSTAAESMELPAYVESIDDFESEVECALVDLRDTLIDPEVFFGETLVEDYVV